MKTVFLLLLFSFSYNSYSADCDKHPIYCQILKNRPKLNKKYAMRLSNIIYKMHRKYHIPSRIFTAILNQESGYSLKAKGCHWGIEKTLKHTNEDVYAYIKVEDLDTQRISFVPMRFPPLPVNKETKVCTDFGISQIYYKTAKRWKFDLEKLTTDLSYSVEAGAKVLHGFMEKYEAKENDWWVRYNCGVRGSTKRDTCQIYKKLVERYL